MADFLSWQWGWLGQVGGTKGLLQCCCSGVLSVDRLVAPLRCRHVLQVLSSGPLDYTEHTDTNTHTQKHRQGHILSASKRNRGADFGAGDWEGRSWHLQGGCSAPPSQPEAPQGFSAFRNTKHSGAPASIVSPGRHL